MAKMHTNDEISARDWVNIGLGAISSSCLVYFSTHSVLTALLAGVPCGAGGVGLAFLLLKKLRPDLYCIYAGSTRIARHVLLRAFVGMLVMTAVYFIVFPSMTSRLVIVTLDIFIIANFIFNRLQKPRDDEHEATDDDHVA